LQSIDPDAKSALTVLLLCRDPGPFLPALDALKAEGLRIRCANNVYRAVADFAREPADVAIVELDGLEGSEFECIGIFRELNREVYILAVFSPAYRHKAAEAVKLGADSCLPEPFYPVELTSIAKHLVQRAAGSREAHRDYREHLAALARLAKGIAHEVNNPLTTLSGWLEMMESDGTLTAEERERVASMREEAHRIAKVVQRLVAFAQEPLEGGSPVDVNAVLAELLEEMSKRAKGTRVEARLQAAGAVVWGDESLLRQACKALLDEAMAALGGGGTLSVQTRAAQQDYLELSIRDDGRPIPAEQLQHIFEPYGSLSRGDEAMDMAYPAAYGIIRGHGGELTVSSDEQRGTEFVVRLPRMPTVP